MTSPVAPRKILVVDDDAAICQLVSRFLKNHYQVETAPNAAIARQCFGQFAPDLVILDVNLPDDSGFNLCREMQSQQTLVLMLTCLTDRDYILEGFDKGADEYLTKPFDLDVLKAKIGALFKRHPSATVPAPNPGDRFHIGSLTIDYERCQVSRHGQPLPFTLLEYELFTFLATHPEKVWGRKELIQAVWENPTRRTVARKVDVHIGQIRRKIGSPENQCIQTIRGKGYLFEPKVLAPPILSE